MRVLHAVYNCFPDETGGAVRTRYLLETQKRLGIEPLVISSPFQAPADPAEGGSVEHHDGIPHYRCYRGSPPVRFMAAGKPWWERAAKAGQMAFFAREIRRVAARERVDVIHAHSVFFCGLAAIAAGRSLGLPVIYELRSLIGEGAADAGPGLRRAYDALDKASCRMAAHVTVISEGLWREVRRWGLPDGKVTVSGNGVDVTRHAPAPVAAGQRIRQQLGFPPGAFVLGFIGTLTAYEGLEVLLDATRVLASRYPELRVLVAGDGPSLGPLLNQAERLKVTAQVRFAGRVPHDDIGPYYQAIDLFVLPRGRSRLTDLVTPMKPLEIMAHARPLLAGDCGGHRELIIEGLNGLLMNASDRAGLVSRLESLVGRASVLERLGGQAREWVAQHRSWESQCRPVVEVYRQITQTGRRRDRVLLVAPGPEANPAGGVETGVGLLLRSPLARRYELRLWDRRPRDGPRPAWPVRLPRRVLEFAGFARCLAAERPKVVHVKSSSGVNFLESAIYLAVSRAFGRRTLLQIHSGEFDLWYGAQAAAGRWGIRRALGLASEILVLSDHWRHVIQPLVPNVPIHVVPNGVEMPELRPRGEREGGILRVLTIATLGRHKGHFDLLAAAELLRDRPIRFLLAGPDSTSGRGEGAQVRQRAKELRLESLVSFLGLLGPVQKTALLAEADVFLLPSYAEGMPNAVLEAMAAGLPVVATRVGAVPEMLGFGQGGRLVASGHVEGLVQALIELQADPALRRTMGEWNRARVEACYRMDGVWTLLDSLYSGQPPAA
jgi:glycogen(starch) synthase